MTVKRRKKSEQTEVVEKRTRVRRREPESARTVAVMIPRPAPKRSARNERTNKPVVPDLDPHGIYGAACLEFCDALGYPANEVWMHWSQMVLMRIYEQRLPLSAASESAWRDLKAMLDKRDAQTEAS